MIGFITRRLEQKRLRKEEEEAAHKRAKEELTRQREAEEVAHKRAEDEAAASEIDSRGLTRCQSDVQGWLFHDKPMKPGYSYSRSVKSARDWPLSSNNMTGFTQCCYDTVEKAFYYRCKWGHYLSRVTLSTPYLWKAYEGSVHVGTRMVCHECYQADFGVVWCVINIPSKVFHGDMSQLGRDVMQLVERVERATSTRITREERSRMASLRDRIHEATRPRGEYHELRDSFPKECIAWLLTQAFRISYSYDSDADRVTDLGYSIFEEMLRLARANGMYDHPDPFYGMKQATIAYQGQSFQSYLTIMSGDGIDRKYPSEAVFERDITRTQTWERDRFVPFDRVIRYEDRPDLTLGHTRFKPPRLFR